MRYQPGEEPASVAGADYGFHVVFRMRHEPEHVELLRKYARNGIGRAVDVPGLVARAVRRRVPEQHPTLVLDPRDRGGAGEIAALPVRDRHADHLARIVAAGE